MGRPSVSRRQLLAGAGAAAVVAACAPASTPKASAGATPLPPPETTTVRISQLAACDPWYWMSDDFLREEGFTDIQYGKGSIAAGTADFGTPYGNYLAGLIEAGVPVVGVGGLHTGCMELFARPGINTIADLRGRTIAVNSKTNKVGDKVVVDLIYGFLVSLFAHVGMQPSDANFVEIGDDKSTLGEFVQGKADAILVAATGGPFLRANPSNPGRVILNTSVDKPWSQNYCCMLATNRDWAKNNPVALKRATRAILRGIDAAKKDLRAAAKLAVQKNVFGTNPQATEAFIYEVVMDESFDWREYEPEETVRFFALRLADAKLVKKSPQQIIAEGMDVSWFHQLRKELKA
jgi:NitT/TauT family transport system substrate-binding protein